MQNDIKMKGATNADNQINQPDESSKPAPKDDLSVDNIFQKKKKW